jgi:glycosyltransferase involved in cell wall biosynthesis
MSGKRLVVLIDRYLPVIGGAQMNVHQLNQDLLQRGFEVQVLTRAVLKDLPEREAIDGIQVRRFGGFSVRVLSKALALVQIVLYLVKNRNDYDLVLAVPCAYYTDVLPAYFAWIFTRKPYVMRTTMTSNFDFMLSLKNVPGSGILKRLLVTPRLWQSVMSSASAVVVQSAVQNASANGYEVSPVAHIPNGVDLDRFRPASAEEKAALRMKLGLPQDRVIIANTARFIPQKNQRTLLEAVRQVEKELRPGRLHTVLLGASEGDRFNDYENELKAFVRRAELPGTAFIRDAPCVENYLRAADIFVFPTMFDEGMSNAVLEAMASGLPVVSSSLRQVKHMFPEEAALFFAPQDAQVLAQHLVDLIDAPEEGLRRGMRMAEFAAAHYRRDQTGARYAAVFEQVLQRTG